MPEHSCQREREAREMQQSQLSVVVPRLAAELVTGLVFFHQAAWHAIQHPPMDAMPPPPALPRPQKRASRRAA